MKATYVTHSGNDMLVVNAARASFGKFIPLDTPLTDGDVGLIRYLARGMKSDEWAALIDTLVNTDSPAVAEAALRAYKAMPTHWAPFAHPHITLQEQMPVFVARQRYKHVIGMVYSEESRRYIDSLPEMYQFDFLRERPEGSIKQGSGGKHPHNDLLSEAVMSFTDESVRLYSRLIQDKVAPEQARAVLTQNAEITCMVTGSLYAFTNSYNQRTDPHAQKEIQILAAEWKRIIEPLYPVSWAALTE